MLVVVVSSSEVIGKSNFVLDSMFSSLNHSNYNQFGTSSKYPPWRGELIAFEKKVLDYRNVTSIVT